MKFLFVLFAATAFLILDPNTKPSTKSSLTLTIHLTNLRSSTGSILVGLYNTADGFPMDKRKVYKSLKIPTKQASSGISFNGLEKGQYAVAIMHDENSNGKMDKNLVGMPTEGFCFSNNVKVFLKAPSFKDARIDLTADQEQHLKVIYF